MVCREESGWKEVYSHLILTPWVLAPTAVLTVPVCRVLSVEVLLLFFFWVCFSALWFVP